MTYIHSAVQAPPLSNCRVFHLPKRTPCTQSTHSSCLLPLVTSDLLSVSAPLPILNVSYKQNLTISAFLCLLIYFVLFCFVLPEITF